MPSMRASRYGGREHVRVGSDATSELALHALQPCLGRSRTPGPRTSLNPFAREPRVLTSQVHRSHFAAEVGGKDRVSALDVKVHRFPAPVRTGPDRRGRCRADFDASNAPVPIGPVGQVGQRGIALRAVDEVRDPAQPLTGEHLDVTAARVGGSHAANQGR